MKTVVWVSMPAMSMMEKKVRYHRLTHILQVYVENMGVKGHQT